MLAVHKLNEISLLFLVPFLSGFILNNTENFFRLPYNSQYNSP